MSNTVLILPVNHGKCFFISLVVPWTLQLIGKPMEIGKKLNPRTACSTAEQIYPLAFEGRRFNTWMLGGSGVLNTPLAQGVIFSLPDNPVTSSQFWLIPSTSTWLVVEQFQAIVTEFFAKCGNGTTPLLLPVKPFFKSMVTTWVTFSITAAIRCIFLQSSSW